MFDDLLHANESYQTTYGFGHLTGNAGKGLAVLTCMDTRIDPLAMLGLVPGDAKILRNAGARATEDALRGLMLATNLLRVDRIAIVQHTDCAMSKKTDEELRAEVATASGVDSSGIEFFAVPDQVETLREDIAVVRKCPQIGPHVIVGGFIYDVHTGALRQVVS